MVTVIKRPSHYPSAWVLLHDRAHVEMGRVLVYPVHVLCSWPVNMGSVNRVLCLSTVDSTQLKKLHAMLFESREPHTAVDTASVNISLESPQQAE